LSTRELATSAIPSASSPTRQPCSNTSSAIVIGSGVGGLAAASLLAQLTKRRVLVLERHFKLGGFTHVFSRQGYTWDPGLHYVGNIGPGSDSRRIFDLISGAGVQWAKMPSPFERFLYPDLEFAVADDPQIFQADLEARFPAERSAIRAWFRDLRRAASWYTRHAAGNLAPAPIAGLLALPRRRLALQTTQAWLDAHVRDPQLKALLVSQWGDYGLPPHLSAFAVHALIATHYFQGGYYPVGGSGTIAAAMVPIIEAAGGACLVNHEVTQVLHREGKAIGVRVRGHRDAEPSEFYAPLILSDAGAYNTYLRLLEPELNLPQQRALQNLPAVPSVVNLYLGFRESPATLGLRGENLWIFNGYDHRAIYDDRNRILEGVAGGAFASFASLKDPNATRHTAQIIAWADADRFHAWREQPWKKRDADYAALKQTIRDALLDLVERHVPGLRQLIDYDEVATPLTVEHFTGHQQGAIYGIPATPARFQGPRFGVRTPIEGLLLTGSDALSAGIMGAVMGGVMAAASVMGAAGYPTILRAAQRGAGGYGGQVAVLGRA